MSAVAFVGRGRELDVLAARLAPHDQPDGGILLISGPAGVGKTRLLDEAVRRRGAGGRPRVLSR